MLDLETRIAVLKLHALGNPIREIARAVGASRNAVRRILRVGRAERSSPRAPIAGEQYLDRIRTLMRECKGNRIRVHEELRSEGHSITYQTLTRLLREHGIGVAPKERVGRYTFEPGEEMQHDTSPIDCTVAGVVRRVQCASLVLCYSRRIFASCTFNFDRFQCRIFLTRALVHFGGAAQRCMVDNTSVIVASGSGTNAIVAPEMEAFSSRFGFAFHAHRIGDANRSARVERPFHFIQNNFFAGRSFETLDDLNAQLLAWCLVVDQRALREFDMTRLALFAVEHDALRPIPAFVPEPVRVHARIANTEGYVSLDTNRYSVDAAEIGHSLTLHETAQTVRIFEHDRLLCSHVRLPPGARKRSILPEHEHQAHRRHPRDARPIPAQEQTLRAAAPHLIALIDAIQKHAGHQAVREIRKLHRLWTEYPHEPLARAVSLALAHGLLEVARIEKRVLIELGHEHFRLPTERLR